MANPERKKVSSPEPHHEELSAVDAHFIEIKRLSASYLPHLTGLSWPAETHLDFSISPVHLSLRQHADLLSIVRRPPQRCWRSGSPLTRCYTVSNVLTGDLADSQVSVRAPICRVIVPAFVYLALLIIYYLDEASG